MSIIRTNQITNTAGDASPIIPGAVLQIQSTTITSTASFTQSGARIDLPGFAVSITPKSSNSKILISCMLTYCTTTDGCGNMIILKRNSTDIGGSVNGTVANGFMGIINNHGQANSAGLLMNAFGQFLDSPNSTNELVYQLSHYGVPGSTAFITNRSETNQLGGISTVTAMEIGG